MRPRRGSFPRSRVPLHRRILLDPGLLRRWIVALAATLAVTVGVARTLGRAEAVRGRWGATRTVLVTTSAVRAGGPLGGAVEPERWPASLVPDGAVDALPDDARSIGPLASGAPITEVALLGADDAGRRRLALPLGEGRLPVAPGDRVDVWATFDPSLAGRGPTTRRVAIDAVVSSADGPVVAVEVADDEVEPLAAALSTATLTLAATP